jgi:hypothetical protein
MINVYRLINNEYFIYYNKKIFVKDLRNCNYEITHDKEFIVFRRGF